MSGPPLLQVSLDGLSLGWEPGLPVWALGAIALAGALTLGVHALRGGRGTVWRGLAIAAALAALAGPSLVRSERVSLPDVVALVVDRSESLRLAGRTEGAELAAGRVRAALESAGNVDVRTVSMPGGAEGTRLAPALDAALADVPADRVAGAIIITDGRIGDAADAARPFALHQILVGAERERDRRLTLVAAPPTTPVGQTAILQVRVDDEGAGPGETVRLTVSGEDGRMQSVDAGVGQTVEIAVPVERRGPIPVGIEADAAPGEVSTANNALALSVTGVRDRLRVMLVTGEPYAGARAWRNLLKADPSVDLVQFTILRPPEKQDFTPIEELSLIPFPVRELFLEKIDSFDLVVFDRFRRLSVLPDEYLESVAGWVEDGGAFLMLAGPAEAQDQGVHSTPLGRVVPVTPSGRAIEAGFRPALTELGRTHPVSAPLAGEAETWGRWLRVQASTARGDVLLEGEGQPLLVLSQIGRGRSAAVMSDQAWLWQRGYEGGGPFDALFRRTAHWLMREPDLDADRLIARGTASGIAIERRAAADPGAAKLTGSALGPTGAAGGGMDVALAPSGPGVWRGSASLPQAGLAQVASGGRNAIALAGVADWAEAQGLSADPSALRLANQRAGGGGVAWIGRDGRGPLPALRRAGGLSASAGAGWFGLRQTDAHTITATRREPLIPAWALAALLALLSVLAWWREGR